jgi:transposase InsO family protein
MKRRETTHAERVEIVERHQAGETLKAIAERLGLSKYTVRQWWRAFRDGGWAALEPMVKGPPVVGPLGRFDPLVKYVALRLKREHPGWGPDMLRLHMGRRPSLQGLSLPKNTALWSYLHQFGSRLVTPRRRPTKRPTSSPVRAEVPHQCWEMDFKGDEVVSGCRSVISPLALGDEASGAPLARCIHVLKAKGNRQGLTMRHVQRDLRQVFTQWGLPDAIRMDRDSLFVGSSRLEWPGTLLLWLVGLGVQPVINRAYRPTDNAMVERSHRTWKGDVLVGGRFADLVALQEKSDQALEDRRLHLPSRHAGCQGQPPAKAYPDLLKPRRPYHPRQERALFDPKRVDAYLTQWEWQRQVDEVGKISLANRNH